MIPGEAALTRRGAPRALTNRKHSFFQTRYFENGPLEPEYF